MRHAATVGLVSVLLPSIAFATEIDNFTQRYEPIQDATAELNAMANQAILNGVNTANELGSCDTEALYDAVADELIGGTIRGRAWAKFETEMEANPKIDKRAIDRESSIYKNVSFFDAPPLFMVALGQIVRFGEHVVGSDKFGHFLSEGYAYYRTAYQDGHGVQAALDEGVLIEATIWGGTTTGVFSYGDLAANFSGMLFWSRLTADHAGGQSPYVICHEGTWLVSETFDWAHYVDAAWDEAVNCNALDEDLVDPVQEELVKLEEATGLRFQCPVAPDACADVALSPKYAPYLGQTISPACQAAAKGVSLVGSLRAAGAIDSPAEALSHTP